MENQGISISRYKASCDVDVHACSSSSNSTPDGKFVPRLRNGFSVSTLECRLSNLSLFFWVKNFFDC
ncbi:hypothetical protein M404DRAFT_1002858 [Pisolithus tinctorius Marx 270]|uniref:Uncharacterized protein n=1 Tax=Pisolithus tinctorius Marx 270 TaxID=870435 RepID=A0A0C3IY40_PISTI|nr:hypothetical protein M404DRAFT_1002858 [Pisolithus tinctorius Marx 270]